MSSVGRTLIVLGMVIVALGVLLYAFPSLPLGRLPGDIRIERPGVRIYLPITTCLAASLILSAVFWLVSRGR
ncbi:MAG: DUF2905 domain-containing protein [Deltaproteobacteria bacterium]|nr:MAG: DUF2905 domain-containing protein [Deltaproteobacteria bacterium]